MKRSLFRKTTEKKLNERRRKIKQLRTVVFKSFVLVVVIAAVFFTANDRFWHLRGVPNSYDAARFLGLGEKPYVELSDGEAAVCYIDVGQGDCELIRTGEYNVLIDCGEAENIDSAIGFLRYSGVDKLDLIIVSHQHADHIGGMSEIFKEFEVGKLIMPYVSDTSELEPCYTRMMYYLDRKKIPYEYTKAGDCYKLGDDIIDIIAPLYDDYDNLNDCSIVARYTHGDNTFLFTGDIEHEGELDILDSGAELDVDVLKVAHHGGDSSSSIEFLNDVSPKIAVIEAGADNPYGHPRTSVIERIEDSGCEKILATLNNGNIVIVSDGAGLSVHCEVGG